MESKILIIDDDPKILKIIRRFLASNAFEVLVADNGSDGLALAREALPDLILVDADMPDLDGHAVCRILKKEALSRRIPVIIMSGSKISDKDVLAGFEGGADDYIMKPFFPPILLARIRAVLKRYAASPQRESAFKKSGIELNPAERTARVDGKSISLTRKEFDLLANLIDQSGRVLSIPYLLETVWGYDPADYNDPGTVEVHIFHLRKKLGPKAGKRIVNVLGHGYKFKE
ncbi:MAG: hypothetical protein A3G41_03220 [Elusimicrobia bacterium RIFCSPLOWO2_12_FULL_59_9]|nr:MAG: hypothetical protein A3G41_03220 [Elusimicrobia bacterium RIFCSPLOWO2_12_FULL_59_9]